MKVSIFDAIVCTRLHNNVVGIITRLAGLISVLVFHNAAWRRHMVWTRMESLLKDRFYKLIRGIVSNIGKSKHFNHFLF